MKKMFQYFFFLMLPLLSFSQVPDSLDSDEEFIIIEQSASFPGGLTEWAKYLNKNMKYPIQAQRMGIEGRVFVQFIVEKDGSLTDIKVVNGIGAGCDEETMRVLREGPNWIPGTNDGEPVRQKMIQNVFFKFKSPKADKKKRKAAQKGN
jgi:periplasmic protein TonB